MQKAIPFVLCFVIFALFFYLFLTSQSTSYICNNCNVILISIDSVRYDHLGINGYQRNATPNLDKFAQNSIFFRNYITQAFLTPISEAAIHTSQYPSVNGFLSFTSFLNPTTTKLEDVLQYNNYNNYAFVGSGNFVGDGTFGDIFSKSYKIYKWPTGDFPLNPDDLKNFTQQKFFLWLSIGNVHWPYGKPYVPEIYIDLFVNKSYSGPLKNKILDINLMPNIWFDYVNLNGTLYHLTPEDRQYIIDNYDAGLKYVDDYVGLLLERARDSGLMNNTVIVIQSEHGESFGENAAYTHGDMYETITHTFLIVNSPSLKKKQEITVQAQGIDVMPTVLDILGIKIPQNIQGQSLVPVILRKVNDSFNKYVFIERTPLPYIYDLVNATQTNAIPFKTYREVLAKFNRADVLKDFENISNDTYPEDFGVRTNEWKLIWRPTIKISNVLSDLANQNGLISQNDTFFLLQNAHIVPKAIKAEFELYYLPNDPYESKNLIGTNLAIENELKQVLFQWRRTIDSEKPQFIFNKTIIPNYTFT